MRKLLTLGLLLGWLAPCVGADPTDKQVLELHQRWNAAVAGANDFNSLAPLMSSGSLQEISSLDGKQQQATLGMIKMAAMMGGSKQWKVESHQKVQNFFVYKLIHQEKSSRGSTEFPVAEEAGQLKVDFRRKR